jgi:hypothetical protein
MRVMQQQIELCEEQQQRLEQHCRPLIDIAVQRAIAAMTKNSKSAVTAGAVAATV